MGKGDALVVLYFRGVILGLDLDEGAPLACEGDELTVMAKNP
jgi:hypothetical protein